MVNPFETTFDFLFSKNISCLFGLEKKRKSNDVFDSDPTTQLSIHRFTHPSIYPPPSHSSVEVAPSKFTSVRLLPDPIEK